MNWFLWRPFWQFHASKLYSHDISFYSSLLYLLLSLIVSVLVLYILFVWRCTSTIVTCLFLCSFNLTSKLTCTIWTTRWPRTICITFNIYGHCKVSLITWQCYNVVEFRHIVRRFHMTIYTKLLQFTAEM